MSELSKTNHGKIDQWRSEIALQNPDLWQSVLFVLGLFQKANILMGDSKFDINDPNQVAFYVKDCLDLGVTIEILMDHHDKVRRELKWWPVSGEFAKAFVEFRKSDWIIHPDFVGYLVHGGAISICDTRQHPNAVSNLEANRLSNEFLLKCRLKQQAIEGSGAKALPAREGKPPSINGVAKALVANIEPYAQSDREAAERKRLLRKQAIA